LIVIRHAIRFKVLGIDEVKTGSYRIGGKK
jgi:hypothetical protein